MDAKSQVPFRLKTETATKQSTRLHQPELIKEWVEFYPEQLEPAPQRKPWWQRRKEGGETSTP